MMAIPSWITRGEINGSLTEIGLIIATHDLRNRVGGIIYFEGYPLTTISTIVNKGNDISIATLASSDLPKPAKIAQKTPKMGDGIYAWDYWGQSMRSARLIMCSRSKMTFIPGFIPRRGTSGGAIINGAGELLGHFTSGTTGPFYGGLLQDIPFRDKEI